MKIFPLLVMLTFVFLGCQSSQNPETGPPQEREDEEVVGVQDNNLPAGFYENYESTNRGIWQNPEMILELLGDLSGKTVADIGAGTGYLTKRIVPVADKVIAIDIDPRFIDFLDSIRVNELPQELQGRLETRLASPDDANLATGEVDAVIIVNTYMYIQDRVAYMRKLKNGISEGGKILIVDFKKKQTPVGPPSNIRTPLFVVEEELLQAGYKNIITRDKVLDYQYIVIAER